LDYLLVDRLLVEAIGLCLTAAMIVALLGALRWRWRAGGGAIPILLLPRWSTAARVLSLWVLLPVAVYVALSFLPLSGRDWRLSVTWPRLALQAVVLVAVVVAGTSWAASRSIRGRCRELGLAVPPAVPPRRGWSLLACSVLLVVMALLPTGYSNASTPRLVLCALLLTACAVALVVSGITWWSLIGAAGLMTLVGLLRTLSDAHMGPELCVQMSLALGGAVVLGFVGVIAAMRLLLGQRQYGLYLGTLARSMLPLLAGAVLLLSLLRPVGAAREAWLVQHDPLLGANRVTVGLTAIEDRATKRLQTELAAALAEP
jgi:hypothetical protein